MTAQPAPLASDPWRDTCVRKPRPGALQPVYNDNNFNLSHYWYNRTRPVGKTAGQVNEAGPESHPDACDGSAGGAVLLGGEARKVLGAAQAHGTQQVVDDRLLLQEGGCCHVHIQREATL